MAQGSYNPRNSNLNYDGAASQNRGFYNKILRKASSFGMDFTDIARNQNSIGINEDPQMVGGGMYDFMSSRAVQEIMSKKSIAALDMSIGEKLRILREYSIKDEIRDMIVTVADEAIVYDEGKKFCKPSQLPSRYSKDIVDKYTEAFNKIYYAHRFNDGITAWNYFKKFLIDGYLAFEIIYDSKGKNVIGFAPIQPDSIVPGFEETTQTTIWIQYPDNPQVRRILLDSQIIYISYNYGDDFGMTSYLEGLIRPYNQLKLIEQAMIMYNLIHARVYQKYTIPVADMPEKKAKQEVAKLIANYSESLTFNDEDGSVTENGQKQLNYNKQIWFPEGTNGKPDMELISPEGHKLTENDMLTWFYNALKRASKIPFSRFDKDNGGGNVFSDASEMTRDENMFSNFISRLRMVFKEIITKPLKIQMYLEFPELADDLEFINSLGVDFNSNELFEEWKRINNDSKRVSELNELLSIEYQGDPNRPTYFHPEYLIRKKLKLTEEEIAENESYWAKQPERAGEPTEGGGGGEDEFGGLDAGGEDIGGGGEEPPTAEADTATEDFEI